MYGDELLASGDRRGELIAVELNLPPVVDVKALEQFTSLAKRLCRTRNRYVEVGWCLGHARSLRLAVDRHPLGGMLVSRLDAGRRSALVAARELMRSPLAARLELFSSFITTRTLNERPWWRRVVGGLPPSCHTVELALRLDPMQAVEAIGPIPPTVRELRLAADPALIATLVSDRFDVIDCRRALLDDVLAGRLADALGHSSAVKLRVGTMNASPERLAPLRDRLTVGGEGDAALVSVDRPSLLLLERYSLIDVQARHGFVPCRSWLERHVPETYGLSANAWPVLWPTFGSHFQRHPDGTWTLKAWPDELGSDSPAALRFFLDGAPVSPGAVRALEHGTQVTIEQELQQQRFTFLTSGIDEAWRAQLVG